VIQKVDFRHTVIDTQLAIKDLESWPWWWWKKV